MCGSENDIFRGTNRKKVKIKIWDQRENGILVGKFVEPHMIFDLTVINISKAKHEDSMYVLF